MGAKGRRAIVVGGTSGIGHGIAMRTLHHASCFAMCGCVYIWVYMCVRACACGVCPALSAVKQLPRAVFSPSTNTHQAVQTMVSCLAAGLAKAGASVTIVGRSPERGAKIVAEMREAAGGGREGQASEAAGPDFAFACVASGLRRRHVYGADVCGADIACTCRMGHML